MKASLDTDIVIHLYKSGRQDILFSFFDELYMYDYLVNVELKTKGSMVYEAFLDDVGHGKIMIITNKDLVGMGIKVLFENYIREYEYLFDQGESYAVALAKAMGISALVTDDTKDFGPHDTLVKELIEDVMPFAFYELLFFKYISSNMTANEVYIEFIGIVEAFDRPMKFYSRISKVIMRFGRNGTNRDIGWMEDFCAKYFVDYNKKMMDLKRFIHTVE